MLLKMMKLLLTLLWCLFFQVFILFSYLNALTDGIVFCFFLQFLFGALNDLAALSFYCMIINYYAPNAPLAHIYVLCYYPSRSSKVSDLYLIWKPVCKFLLVINSNLGLILHHFATVHLWQMDGRTDRLTDKNHVNSAIITKVRSAKN